MKFLIFLLAFLTCLLCFGATEQDVEHVKHVKLDWNDNTESDFDHYTVHCMEKDQLITLTSPNVSVTESFLSLENQQIRSDLGITKEGQKYDCAVVAWDHNQNNSNFSPVVTLFFDMTPPLSPSGLSVSYQ